MQVSGYLVAFPTREHPHDSAPRGQCLGALENSLMCDVMLLPQVCVLALELVNILSYLVVLPKRNFRFSVEHSAGRQSDDPERNIDSVASQH